MCIRDRCYTAPPPESAKESSRISKSVAAGHGLYAGPSQVDPLEEFNRESPIKLPDTPRFRDIARYWLENSKRKARKVSSRADAPSVATRVEPAARKRVPASKKVFRLQSSRVGLGHMPVEVFREIAGHLGRDQRWAFGLSQFEMATAVFESYVSQAQANVRAASEIHQEALRHADPVTPTEVGAISEIMEDAITAIHRLKYEEFVASASTPAPSQLVLLAQRVVGTVLERKFPGGRPTGVNLDASESASVREMYKELLVDQDGEGNLSTNIAALDLVYLGACFGPEIDEMMAAFATLVAEDDFANGIHEPHAEWAIVICLWLRRISQVCAALGHSMHTTHSQRILDHATKQQTEMQRRHGSWSMLTHIRSVRQAGPESAQEAGDPAEHSQWRPEEYYTSQEFVEAFINTPTPGRARLTSEQFIKTFLRSGFGSPIHADNPSRDPVKACDRLQPADQHQGPALVMPQLG
eukprot:TRINITY_DN198_c0_g1_i7.p1 TRINITY_DN198_c0_g1~~TRINITY_DN198_c0_g1_i7.p1  ORF type:complete len:469 (+),score=73.38 TRINITY_DN198_c0_g1_i7:77-1483(+)